MKELTRQEKQRNARNWHQPSEEHEAISDNFTLDKGSVRDTDSRGNVAKPAVYLYSFVRDRVTKEIDGIKRIQNGLKWFKRCLYNLYINKIYYVGH